MPLPLTQREKSIVTVLALLVVLGLIGMAVL
jgi:Tfp pilus assembly protein PilX